MWITNVPEIATALRAADIAYEKAIAKARNLKLADKAQAMRVAAATRDAAYKNAMTVQQERP